MVQKPTVFISWSGELSKTLASLIHDWLQDVLRQVEPWVSNEDMRKGVHWGAELNRKLADASIGIVVLTPENLSAPWILFEAGAVSKALPESRCCTMLFDLKPTDVTGPLAQFQATVFANEDLWKLIKSINDLTGDARVDEVRLRRWFDGGWSQLAQSVEAALKRPRNLPRAAPPSSTEMLEEVLSAVRRIERSMVIAAPSLPEIDWDSPGEPPADSAFAAFRASNVTYSIGEFVVHPQFGVGRVMSELTKGLVLTVAFKDQTRKLVAPYAKLQKVPAPPKEITPGTTVPTKRTDFDTA